MGAIADKPQQHSQAYLEDRTITEPVSSESECLKTTPKMGAGDDESSVPAVLPAEATKTTDDAASLTRGIRTKRTASLAVGVGVIVCCFALIVTCFSLWISSKSSGIPTQDLGATRLGNVQWLPVDGNSTQFNVTTFRPGKHNNKPLIHKLLVDPLLPPPPPSVGNETSAINEVSIQASNGGGLATPQYANLAIVAQGDGRAIVFARAVESESALYVSEATLTGSGGDGHDDNKLGEVALTYCRDCINDCERVCSEHPSGRCTAWTFSDDGTKVCELFSDCELRSGANSAVVTGICNANCPSHAYATAATGEGVYLGRRHLLQLSQQGHPHYAKYPRNTCESHLSPDSSGSGDEKVGMTKWKSLGGVVKDGPSAFSPDPSSTIAFVRGSDDQIWYIQRRGQWWGSWQAIAGSATSSPAATGKGREMLVFVRGSDSQLWMASTDDAGTSWRWNALGGSLLAGTSPAAARSPTGDGFGQIAVTNVVVVGRDERLWQLQLRGATVDREWRELPVASSGLQITSSPAVVATYDASRRQTTVEITVRGSDGVTLHQSRSVDNGLTFIGGWVALGDGSIRAESPPSGSAWESREVVMGAVGRNARVHLQLRRLPYYGNPGNWEWTRLRRLPEEQPAPAPPLYPTPPPYQPPPGVDCGAGPVRPSPPSAPGSPPSLGLGCTPCGSCSFWDEQCWAVCQISCYRIGECADAGAGLETMAAKRSCAFVWEACGTSTSRNRSPTGSATIDNLLVGKEACAAIVEDYCRDSLWNVDLYAIADASYKESCGQIVYGGSQRCTQEFAFNLFEGMVDMSCRLAVAEFYTPGSK